MSKESQEIIEMLRKQLKESNQKTLLVEEQLRIRSGFDPLGHDADPMGASLAELALLPPSDAWAVVGRGAADRICGVVPHGAMDFPPRPARLRSDGIYSTAEHDVQQNLIEPGSTNPEAPSAAIPVPQPAPNPEVASPRTRGTSSVGFPVEALQQNEPDSPTVAVAVRSPRRARTLPPDKVNIKLAEVYLEDTDRATIWLRPELVSELPPTDRHPQASSGIASPLSPGWHTTSQQTLHQQQHVGPPSLLLTNYVQVPGRQAVAPTAATGQVP